MKNQPQEVRNKDHRLMAAVVAERAIKWKLPWQRSGKSVVLRYFLALGIVFVATVSALSLEGVAGHRGISLIFLLAVVAPAPFLGRGPTLFASVASALSWDFFFTQPMYSLWVSDLQDQVMLGIYFFVALLLGQLTARIREQEMLERQREERATALYLLTRELTSVSNVEQLVQRVSEQLKRAFNIRFVLFLTDQFDKIIKHHPASSFQPHDQELDVALWAFEHGQAAGKLADNFSEADALYLPLQVGSKIIGVIGLEMDPALVHGKIERNLLDALTQEIAIALERLRLQEATEKTKLLAESERLSNTLLDSISHEIRTPLAVIESAASHLAESEKPILTASQSGMVAEIREATERLNGLVGNVLNFNRLESGHTKPKLAFCDASDLISSALEATRKKLSGHVVTLDLKPNLPPVRVDCVLMHHALTNLLANAAFHTPKGTAIQVSARQEGEWLVLEVTDRGPGIPPDSIGHVFDKFHRAINAPTGGIGLGLSIVKGFVEAHGGQVLAQNREGGGAAFIIRLKLDSKSQPSM